MPVAAGAGGRRHGNSDGHGQKPEPAPGPVLRWRCWASIKLQSGQTEFGHDCSQRALEQEPAVDWPQRGEAEADFGLACLMQGDEPAGLRWLHSAQRRFEAAGQHELLAKSLWNEAQYCGHQGKHKAELPSSKHDCARWRRIRPRWPTSRTRPAALAGKCRAAISHIIRISGSSGRDPTSARTVFAARPAPTQPAKRESSFPVDFRVARSSWHRRPVDRRFCGLNASTDRSRSSKGTDHMKLLSCSTFRGVLAVAAIMLVPVLAQAGDWRYRLYGYTPRNYGYAPSNYIFPRYGLVRGYVYFEGPAYGSPELDSPRRCPPRMVGAEALQVPVDEAEPIPVEPTETSIQPERGVVRPAAVRKSCFIPPPGLETAETSAIFLENK